MAIVKHIKSRNANYSAAINYLLFEHDEKTGKKIVDESGRSILRKEFYMDGLNCDPMSFDKECELTNAHFHKNKKREDIKSHHYIISYDPADVTENGLTGERAQAISLELAKQMFPGYQALVVTHTDGHNESGNIHTHIVINSVRKDADALTKEFCNVLFSNNPAKLDEWINEAQKYDIPELQTFINGIKKDLTAVKNGIIYSYNNGLAEGSVNKIKVIKRIMYGRNSFELLKAKVLFGELFHVKFN